MSDACSTGVAERTRKCADVVGFKMVKSHDHLKYSDDRRNDCPYSLETPIQALHLVARGSALIEQAIELLDSKGFLVTNVCNVLLFPTRAWCTD